MAKKAKFKYRVVFQTRNEWGNHTVHASFYTTAQQIIDGVGDNTVFNTAVKYAYDHLTSEGILGTAGQFNGIFIQLDKIEI